jgi:hypothetical protein
MSRAKKFTNGNSEIWFDYKSPYPTVEQLSLLSDLADIQIDDLLDEGMSQKQVAFRLHELDGLIPEEVLERRRQRRVLIMDTPKCRWSWIDPEHECEGYSTRHHFVPRWLMLLLENYESYAPRTHCTIPVCLGRHRDLHMRGGTPKSIVDCLEPHERAFAQKMIDELREQHPAVFDLLAGGSEASYEAQLIKDYLDGEFRRASRKIDTEVLENPVQAQAVALSLPANLVSTGM